MRDITLYGAGGHSFAVIELIKSLGEYSPVVILDDIPKLNTILGIPVEKSDAIKTTALCVSIGNNKNRKKIASLFDVNYPTFIHSSVVKYPSVKIGKGTVVLPNAVLDADLNVGDFCIINNNATVSHNVIVGDYVHIAINVAIAGGAKIGEGTLLGAGCVVLPNIKIGKWVTIGAGTIVTKDIPDNAVVYGNPAKIIHINNNE